MNGVWPAGISDWSPVGASTRPDLVSANVGDGDAVAVAVGRSVEAALVGGRGIERIAGVDGRAAGEERTGLGDPAVGGQRPKERIDQAQIAGPREVAGAIGVKVVAE